MKTSMALLRTIAFLSLEQDCVCNMVGQDRIGRMSPDLLAITVPGGITTSILSQSRGYGQGCRGTDCFVGGVSCLCYLCFVSFHVL